MLRNFIITGSILILTGCVSMAEIEAENAEQEALEAKAESVRFISPAQTETCTYVTQVSAIAGLSFFGGMEATEKTANTRLKVEALKAGGNGLRISDRLLDKGRGGSDQTKLTLYGDVYNCE